MHQRWVLGVAGEDGGLFNRSPAHNAWADETTALPPQERKTPDAGIMCQVVSLGRKGDTYVMAAERQFTLIPGAVLHDAQKKPLTLQGIPLPCHASFCYYLRPNQRDACLVSLCLMPER